MATETEQWRNRLFVVLRPLFLWWNASKPLGQRFQGGRRETVCRCIDASCKCSLFTFWGSNLGKALHFFLWGAFSALRGLARKLRWRQRLHDSEDAQLWTVCSCQRFGITSTSWNLCSIKQKNDMPEATTVLIQPIHWENRIWISSHYLLLLQLANQRCTNNPQQPMKFVQ